MRFDRCKNRRAGHRGAARAFALAALLLALPAPATAAPPEGNPDLLKVSESLLELRRLEAQPPQARLRPPVASPFRRGLPPMRGGKAEVRVSLSRVDGSVLERIESAGATVLSSSPRYRRAVLRIGAGELDELAAIPEVQRIAPAWRPRLQTGTVVTQGDASMNADDARSTFSLTGSGVTIGILSDSFQRGTALGGSIAGSGCSRAVTGMSNQASGDLPTSVGLLDDCDQELGTCGGDPSDDSFCCSVAGEGAAMGEILHDVAPSSPLLFHTAFYSETDFALGIEELVDCGADVLVDDVVWFDEPIFEDGIIARAAQAATEAGAAYYSSAGNYATFGIDDIFVDNVPDDDDENDPAPGDPPSGDDFHDFATDDPYAAVNMPAGCGVIAVLQWDEPWESLADPGGGTIGAESDLDLYFCDVLTPTHNCGYDPMDGGGALRSATRQGCGTNGGNPATAGDAVEILEIINTGGSPLTGYFAVEHHCGNQSDLRFRIVTLPSNGCSYPGSFDFEDGLGSLAGNPIWVDAQIFGQAAAKDAVAVAASYYLEKDQGGDVDPPDGVINVETFSSAGGDLPFSDATTRWKPEVTGPDCGNNTFFGFDLVPSNEGEEEPPDADEDTDPNFCGTSAAAPHVAGVAALLRQANPGLRPSQIRQILQDTALDIEGAGVDARSGSGFVIADSAAALACDYLGVTPAELDYATLPLAGGSRDLEVLLSQPSCASGSAAVSAIGTSDGDFTASTGGSSSCASLTPTLSPGSSCTFEVSFDPSSTGAVAETLTVTSNQPSVGTPLVGDAIDCASDADLTLDNTTVTDDTALQACDTITVGPSVDVTTGDLSLLAGVSITFDNGTSVVGPGNLTVALDGILATP